MAAAPQLTESVAEVLSDADVAALATHARLREALAAYCREMIRGDAVAWPKSKLFDQYDRYLIGFFLVRNYWAWRDAGAPPPTLTQLQALKPASPRQVAAFVAVMKARGMVTAEPVLGDRRLKALVPAHDTAWVIGRSMLAFVRVGDALHGARRAARIAVEPASLGRLVACSAESVLTRGFGLIAPFQRVMRFTSFDCGFLILTAVMAAHYAAGEARPGPSLAYRALARRFQVSASHVGNVLGEARRRGWLATDSEGQLDWVSPELVAEFELWCCGQTAHYARMAEAALRVRSRD